MKTKDLRVFSFSAILPKPLTFADCLPISCRESFENTEGHDSRLVSPNATFLDNHHFAGYSRICMGLRLSLTLSRSRPRLLGGDEALEFLEPVGDDIDFRTGTGRFSTFEHEEPLPIRTHIVLPPVIPGHVGK